MTGLKHGLYIARTLTCACGKAFTGRKPNATYCSNECRRRIGRYGQSHGQYEPRAMGVTRA